MASGRTTNPRPSANPGSEARGTYDPSEDRIPCRRLRGAQKFIPFPGGGRFPFFLEACGGP